MMSIEITNQVDQIINITPCGGVLRQVAVYIYSNMCVCMCACTHMYIYTYVYISRETDREV